MRFVYPINVPESAKPGDNLNAKLDGVFKTTGTAVLQEDGSILVEPEELLSDEDKKRGKFIRFILSRDWQTFLEGLKIFA